MEEQYIKFKKGIYSPAEQEKLDAFRKETDSAAPGTVTRQRVVDAHDLKNWIHTHDPYNPLFNDLDYAAKSRWGGLIAPVGLVTSLGKPQQAL